jgi:hypothetical protein
VHLHTVHLHTVHLHTVHLHTVHLHTVHLHTVHLLKDVTEIHTLNNFHSIWTICDRENSSLSKQNKTRQTSARFVTIGISQGALHYNSQLNHICVRTSRELRDILIVKTAPVTSAHPATQRATCRPFSTLCTVALLHETDVTALQVCVSPLRFSFQTPKHV